MTKTVHTQTPTRNPKDASQRGGVEGSAFPRLESTHSLEIHLLQLDSGNGKCYLRK